MSKSIHPRITTWDFILTEAARIARSYSTAVTLRQLHYRLVAASIGGYRNDQGCYKQLSSRTAEARRAGWFPSLSDFTRGVDRPISFASPAEAIARVAAQYRRDRTENQEFQVWVLYEKATLGAQIQSWVREYGIPTAALRGYSSESLEREVIDAINKDGRPAIVFYVGDLDPEGEDIERNFLAQAERLGVTFEKWDRLAVNVAQIAPLGLVPNPGKSGSSRAAGFIAKHGQLFQIEAEAIDPGELERLVTEAILDTSIFDADTYDGSVDLEADERAYLTNLAEEME